MNPWLRVVVLCAEMLYREYGCRPRIVRFLGRDDPFASGNACEIAAGGLPITGPKSAALERQVRLYPEWIAQRLSYLYPYGSGGFETAVYQPASHRILLRVPPMGYRRDSLALADWGAWGSTPGRVYHPCRTDV